MSATIKVVEDQPSIATTGAAPKYPVQSANVLTNLHENIVTEYAAVRARELALKEDLEALGQYRSTLEAVARAAGIALP